MRVLFARACVNLVAAGGEDGNSRAADAARGARDEYGAACGLEAALLELVERERGCEARESVFF